MVGTCVGAAQGLRPPPTPPKSPGPSAHPFPAVPLSPGASVVGLAAAPDVRGLPEEAIGEV